MRCKWKRSVVMFGIITGLSACVSYYDDFDYSRGYNPGYNSVVRIRPLTENDFFMMNHNSGDYWNAQFWSGVGSLGSYSINSFARYLRP